MRFTRPLALFLYRYSWLRSGDIFAPRNFSTLPFVTLLCYTLFSIITEVYSLQKIIYTTEQLVKTLARISENAKTKLPLLFVRVRNRSQLKRLPVLLGGLTELLTGVIFPKFDLSNAADYCALVGDINSNRSVPLYFMPLLESADVMNLASRNRALFEIRETLDACKEYVLNIRVGALDFCGLYGLRRTVRRSIYDIGVVQSVLTDILTVFADSYVVSAPVWEYFQGPYDDESWATGLENELSLDAANGFIGKTVIHPSQIPIVKKWLQPTRADYEDAKAILEWNDTALGVAKSVGGNRMNEAAVHKKWARKILIMANIHGVRDL